MDIIAHFQSKTDRAIIDQLRNLGINPACIHMEWQEHGMIAMLFENLKEGDDEIIKKITGFYYFSHPCKPQNIEHQPF